MQFSRGGPEIPNDLVDLHEEGSVIFFTGAGISLPAGLPSFKHLTERVFEGLRMSRSEEEAEAFRSGRYDTVLGLLEGRLRGQRAAMREQIVKALVPDLTKPHALRTHKALLRLGRTRKGALRLVTTNFDRLFDEAADGDAIRSFAAPFLPVPKATWDGLVYLHGHLEERNDPADLNQLVVSSGDFGRAYLAERWAARFVTELFRNYTVCFIGYSIEDPVLRYMMDALAADEMLGEQPKRMYAFAKCEGDEMRCVAKWQAKGVTPILFKEFAHLHETIDAWSTMYRDGINGKEALVVQLAGMQPSTSELDDDVTGRMVWALSDLSGAPAKRFAEMDPVPSLAWLEPLAEERFGNSDLVRFGISPLDAKSAEVKFSLLSRPAPHTHAERLSLVGSALAVYPLDPCLLHLGTWLGRHAHDPALLLWVCRNGGRLHEQFAWHINKRIKEKDFPEFMRVAWQLVIARRTIVHINSVSFLDWKTAFDLGGMTSSNRQWLRELLTPKVRFSEHTMFTQGARTDYEPRSLKEVLHTSITLAGGVDRYSFVKLDENGSWRAALPSLVDDATALLRDALQLMEEVGLASEAVDGSSFAMPSVSEHDQNRHADSWTLLIRFCREAWLALAEKSNEHARWVVEGWSREKYPTFRRLVLFASTLSEVIPASIALKHLLHSAKSPLWSFETRREALRLIVSLAGRLSAVEGISLQKAILAGPPKELLREDLPEEDLRNHHDRSVWIRLAKYQHAGGELSEESRTEYEAILKRHPHWELAQDESDEFNMYMGRVMVNAPPSKKVPEDLEGLVDYLRANPKSDPWEEDDFSIRARSNVSTTAEALAILRREGLWLADRWKDALQAWAVDEIAPDTWPIVSAELMSKSNAELRDLGYAIGSWLRHVVKGPVDQDDLFKLLRKVVEAYRDLDIEDGGEPVNRAINHPVGMATEAALGTWYNGKLRDGLGLAEPMRTFFSGLCDTEVQGFRHARTLLAAQAVSLYRVDPDWTRQHLLPCFDRTTGEEEAFAAWYGMLWSGNMHWGLLQELKPLFAETVKRAVSFGETEERIAGMLAMIAISDNSPFDRDELTTLVQALEPHTLSKLLYSLYQSLDGSGAQKDDFWENRIVPFIRDVWPKESAKNDPQTGQMFARIVLTMGHRMEDALTVTRTYLGGDPSEILYVLRDSELPRTDPSGCLELLFRMARPTDPWPKDELSKVLEVIIGSDPSLAHDDRYHDLRAA
jgi:hypothetical protein